MVSGVMYRGLGPGTVDQRRRKGETSHRESGTDTFVTGRKEGGRVEKKWGRPENSLYFMCLLKGKNVTEVTSVPRLP